MVLAALVEAALANPFTDAAASAPAMATLAKTDLAAELGELLRRDHVEAAERLVLAVGHARASADPDDPAPALGEHTLPKALERRLPRKRGAYLRIAMAAARCRDALSNLHGRSAALGRVRRETWTTCFGQSLQHALELERLIHDHDVLLLGETGIGKEVVAHAILEAAPGSADGSRAPRSTLNVAAVPETLVESELFGHVRGAFTGATSDRKGRIRSAAGGCFFLDEVGDLTPTAQAKLLRVMENDLVTPIGSDVEHRADVRYIAATHKPIEKLIAAGSFRQDLYERIAGHVIHIPPLRERPDDVVDIGLAILERELSGQTIVDPAPIERWLRGPVAQRHTWNGNVRELENVLRDLMLGLDPQIATPRALAADSAELPVRIRERAATLREVSDWYVARVVDKARGNQALAARTLGIDRTTLDRKLRPKS